MDTEEKMRMVEHLVLTGGISACDEDEVEVVDIYRDGDVYKDAKTGITYKSATEVIMHIDEHFKCMGMSYDYGDYEHNRS
jgi:hypothetical protein